LKNKIASILTIIILGLSVFSAGYFYAYLNPVEAALPTKWDTQGPDCSFSYCVFTDGTTIWAKNGTTGVLDFSSTNAYTVLTNVVGALTSGGVIYVNQGNYTINSQLSLDDNITLAGTGKSTVLFTSSNVRTLEATDAVNIVIRDLMIQGNPAQTGANSAIQLNNVTGALIENIEVYNTGRHGIWTQNGDNIWVKNNYVHDGGITAASSAINMGWSGPNRGLNVFVVNNIVKDRNGGGIQINNVSDVTVTGNIVHAVTNNGIDLTNITKGIISNNHISNTTLSGVNLNTPYALDVVMTNNRFENISQNGLYALDGSQRFTFSNNHVINANNGVDLYGDSGGIGITGAVIRGNIINGSDNIGIRLRATTYSSVEGNLIIRSDAQGLAIITVSNRNSIVGNVVLENGQDATSATRYGIMLTNADFNLIEANYITDNQGVKTQQVGINISDAASATNILIGNYLLGNVAALDDSGTSTRLESNHGYNPVGTIANPVSGGLLVDSGAGAIANNTSYQNMGSPKTIYITAVGGMVDVNHDFELRVGATDILDTSTQPTVGTLFMVNLEYGQTFRYRADAAPTVVVIGR
jgi:nitrous oxidase accessory protein NosD